MLEQGQSRPRFGIGFTIELRQSPPERVSLAKSVSDWRRWPVFCVRVGRHRPALCSPAACTRFSLARVHSLPAHMSHRCKARTAMTKRREHASSWSDGRSRSPARRPDTEDPDRSLEELARLGWTKGKADKVLQMYRKWGYDEISKDIQRRTKNGFISLREAQRIATGTPTPREE